MKADLDALKDEILSYLESSGFATYYGTSRYADPQQLVRWDVENQPDFHGFLRTAAHAGAKLIVFHQRRFAYDEVEGALLQLEESEIPREEKRIYEKRLHELEGYEDFTCAIELSFDFEGRIYLYSARTDWYDELLDLMDELDHSFTDDEEENDEGPMGGYFSRN